MNRLTEGEARRPRREQAVPLRQKEDAHPLRSAVVAVGVSLALVAAAWGTNWMNSRQSFSDADIEKACALISNPKVNYRQGNLQFQTGSREHSDDLENGIYKSSLDYVNDIYIFDLETQELAQLTDTPGVNETDVGVFGDKLAYVKTGPARKIGENMYTHDLIPESGVYVMDLATRREQLVAKTPDENTFEDSPVISGDGNYVAWVRRSKIREQTFADNILVSDLRTGSSKQITSYFAEDGWDYIGRLAISPDSTQIGFMTTRGVEVMALQGGGKPRKVTPSGHMDGPEGSDQEFVWVNNDHIAVLNQRRMNRGMISEEFPHDKLFRRRYGIVSLQSGEYRNMTGECYEITQR